MNRRRRANLLFYQERAFQQTLPVAGAFAGIRILALCFAFFWVSAASWIASCISLALASTQNPSAQKLLDFARPQGVWWCQLIGPKTDFGEGIRMPKYLVQANYTAEGLKGLMKDKGSGRQAAVSKAITGLGGKLEAFYFSFGETDAVVIADLPDNVSAAALSLQVCASGLAATKTTPLLTVAEIDQALQKSVDYRPPGR